MTLTAQIVITWPQLHLDVDLQVQPGHTLAIMGPNGAGKSTILRSLAGLLPIQKGRVLVNGHTWDDPDSGVLVPSGARNVGLVFQDHLLFAHMTVLDNVAFGPRARGHSRSEARHHAADCLERLGLSNLSDARPTALSGGQSQRVALARALVNRPDILLLDEPLASLDVVTRRQMRSEISRDLATYSPMTILVTHDPEDARHFADNVIVVEDGQIVQHGSPDELSAQPTTAYVAELFGPT